MTERADAGLLCPSCRVVLVMTDRQGVEIDYCPHCRGVWLDRGELDKIIERNAAYGRDRDGDRRADDRWGDRRDYDRRGQFSDDDDDDRRRVGDRGGWDRDREHGRRRRGSFLDDLFDLG